MSNLRATGVVAGYGSHTVLHGVDLSVEEGEVVALLGLNGAGKSVTLRTLTGILPVRAGTVRFGGADVTRFGVEARTRLGMVAVPQGRGIFTDLTVEQNLRVGGYLLNNSEYRSARAAVVDRFEMLGARGGERAGNLSGGQQAILAVARALLARPRLLILDEPTAGLAPSAIATMLEVLKDLQSEGMTMLLVEQNVGFAMALAQRLLLMQKGVVVEESSPGRAADRKALLEALGAGELTKRRSSRATVTKVTKATKAER
ncbi:MAG TPA: ABC transporter ATP-binding protein [Acidimicrobiales bacterium]|nr:ABC transporter ATP-binding protein [Acidimicrobiales bacterium]